jgi:hypothetical protein
MPTPDEQFEQMIRQFRPVSPEPIRLGSTGATNQHWLRLALVAATIVLVLVGYSKWETPRIAGNKAGAIRQLDTRPLTIRTANLLLKQAPSLEEAYNRLATQSQDPEKRSDQQTAFTVLGKEPGL